MKIFDNIRPLSVNEMKNVKGGATVTTSVVGVTVSVTTDDKRTARPGGGITTL